MFGKKLNKKIQSSDLRDKLLIYKMRIIVMKSYIYLIKVRESRCGS